MLEELSIGYLIAAIVPIVSFMPFAFGLWYRFKKLERQAAHRQEDSEMFFRCFRGCLDGLVQVGANGAVERTLKELNDYQARKASGRMKD